ncbi:hypothetical protein EfmAA242_17530 [Enterococcus faecium]|nr:hypothetical protein EfmAA242_17530 [Enterococcus faecium]
MQRKITGELEKIKKRLEPEESIDVPVKTRKEKTTDLEAEERRGNLKRELERKSQKRREAFYVISNRGTF